MSLMSIIKPSRLRQPDAAAAALKEPLEATLVRWQTESAALARSGVYRWLAGRVPGRRVLEIGCGFGASTRALAQAGKEVFALDNRMDCLQASQQWVPEATYGMADVHHYDERLLEDLGQFAPDAVVCWLAGAPSDALPRDVPEAYAVMQHRLVLQQAVVRLAARLATVKTVHLADRTAFAWKMKDTGRQTLVHMLTSAVLLDTPFEVAAADVQFRKLEGALGESVAQALPGVVPVIGEATLKRRHNAA